MAEEKAKGSIIYELLIVVLAGVLVASIIYPKKLTEREEENTRVCRERMSDILNAELQYQKYNDVYSDSLPEVIDFLRTSQEYSTYIDSVIKRSIDSVVTKLNEIKGLEETVLANVPAALDTIMIDSLSQMQQEIKMDSRALAGYIEFIHDRMKNLPNSPIRELKTAFLKIDSKQFTLDMDIVRNLIESGDLDGAEKAAIDVLENMESVIDKFNVVLLLLEDIKGEGLDSLYLCPTVHKPHRLVHVDTSIIKYLNVYCPIDSNDIQMTKSDFVKSRIGGLQLVNHGYIEKGEKSWETGQ
ncbi:MAG: hypothetical protein ACE5NG_01015 [bacterium]